MTETELLERCCQAPGEHLSHASFDQFAAYELGYTSLGTMTPEAFSASDLGAAIRSDYGIDEWPGKLGAWSVLTAIHGPEDGLRRHLEYRRRLAKPASAAAPNTAWRCDDLFPLLAPGGKLREHPALFYGNDASAEHLWSTCSGLRWAERDAGCVAGGTEFMTGFQDWLVRRFPFARHMPWGRALCFLALGSASESQKIFFEYYDFFRQGEPPDCPSTAARTIIGTITAKHGAPSDELKNEITKRIAPI